MTSLPNGFRIVSVLGSILLLGAVFDPPGDGILFRDSLIVPKQETYSGNLIAVESTVTLEEGSTFDGNLILAGGSLESAGAVTGDIASLGAFLHFARSASVDGNVVSIGPEPEIDGGATIRGSIHSMEGFTWPGYRPGEEDPSSNKVKEEGDLGYALTVVLFRMFLLSAIATLIVLFLPTPAERVARTIVVKPAVSFLIGLLTMMAAIALFLLLALSVCLSPISVLGTIVLLAASLLGWTAMGREIGRRGCWVLGIKPHPAVMAGVGTAILTLVASGLGCIPLAGSLLILLMVSFGLGAVVLTRFGGPNYLILASTPPDTPEQG